MSDRVAILGVGLIGGSLALGLKERTNCEVIGFDRSLEDLHFAKLIGALDRGTTSLAEAVVDCDYIIIALPVRMIKVMMEELAALSLKPGCVITDVGSTKMEVMDYRHLFDHQQVVFIGGHPMAGSHRSGIQAAHSLLFENAYYVLTPGDEALQPEVDRLQALLKPATHALFIQMEPRHHDRVVGAISHLPHIIASGLVNLVGDYNQESGFFHRLAAGGFRDLTRIGASDPTMWQDILLTNRHEILRIMEDWLRQMASFQEAIATEDDQKIISLFTRSKQLRERLPERDRGILAPRYECFVDIPDHPGMIGKVAVHLGDAQVSIRNIEVMENRVDHPGVLRLTFKTNKDLLNAIMILRSVGYIVFTGDEL
ncbi:prephenate dehydrogenase [Hazenella sp. IB182357]|uniref:Prephenate dehydrogenase n=1 Tax=Polycladospora coralii TaxID=2771432 RepID=A0A926RTE8_9BACL|nr:prephenate dehydrogenase [Polycladospora coralii]MBD1371608.1 prephenate dehydrogenase [Polycladospora coralii]MBS7529075.1 prephenate dehydrogenase [Polycladospora coralii]